MHNWEALEDSWGNLSGDVSNRARAMLTEKSVTQWIDGLRAGEAGAAQQLWTRYFERLNRVARRRLPQSVRRVCDEEDVALSAFHSLCEGIGRGRFPDLHDRSDLWPLLVCITARKSRARVREAGAQKRGGGRVRGESALQGSGETARELVGREPTPAFAAELAEESSRLLDFLADPSLRRLAVLKMDGHSHEEIAAALSCSVRTVERRLALIRKLWIEHADRDDGNGSPQC